MISIVVPTYNERDNTPELIRRIDSSLKSSKYREYEVVVADDDSPDKTWKVTEELSESYPIQTVRRKNERGRATAVLRGIEEADSNKVVLMDADLQHPPEKIPELIKELENGADISIGSRYVSGGSVGDFSFFRRAVSRGADFFVKTIFREARSVKDIQSGFLAFKREVIKNSDLHPSGYKLLGEIIIMGNHGKISEVGYKFGKRHAGESKLGIRKIIAYLRHLFSLAWRSGELLRFIKFCIVGGMGVAVNLGLLYLLTVAGLFYLASAAIAIEVSLLFNFFFNRAWTFRDRRIEKFRAVATALGKDHLARTGGIALNLLFLWILTEYLGLWYIFSQLVGIGMATLWNFGGNKWWTWGK